MTLPLEIMTSDPDTITNDTDKPETFRSHLPKIVAATVGTVLATVLGSLMGSAGTIAGMTLGSMASGTFAWWTKRGIRRSTAMAAARAEALRGRSEALRGRAGSIPAPGEAIRGRSEAIGGRGRQPSADDEDA